MKRFLPVSIHVHGRDSRIYAKNKAGRKRYYKPEETKDLLKTGGSVFGLKDHYQRFKNFFSLLKNTVVGHGGRRVKDKTKLSKNRKIGAQLAEAAYSKKAPQNFRVYRRERNGHYTIFRQDTKPRQQERYTIAYRGTRPTSGSDLYQDLNLALGKTVPRAKQLSPEIDQFLSNHKNAIVSMAGHSLGSNIALDHFTKFKSKHRNLKNAYLYALPGTPMSVGQQHAATKKALSDKRVEVTVKNGDPVSIGLADFKPKNLVTLTNDSGLPISIRNHGTKNFAD